METLPEKQTVILPEGVTDQKGLLKAGLDYSAPADAVGLSVQPDLTKRSKEFAAMHCDADVSEFSPGTLAVLDEVGKLLKQAQSAKGNGLFSFSDQFSLESLARMDSINLETLLNDILEKRNHRLVVGINKVLPTYQHIAIPWGAAHMPGIERALLQQKARKISSKRVAVFRWSELKWPIEL